MNCGEIIVDFLKEYGNPVDCGGKKLYGIFSPQRDLGVEKRDLLWDRSGYLPKERMLFLFPISDPLLPKGEVLSVGERQFRVQETEVYRLGGKDIYQRVYACEIRSVEG